MGDLKHIIDAAQVKDRMDPSRIHAQHNILYDDNERSQVELVEQIGSSLFATTLLVASCWQSRQDGYHSANCQIDLESELKGCFVSFLSGYLGMKDHRKVDLILDLLKVDFNLMAKQIRMFSTMEYVKVAETAPKRPCFGLLANCFGHCTHPTAYVHFAQRGSLDLSAKPGRSIESIRMAYCNGDNESSFHPRIDTSMMRSSPNWVKGKGWVAKSKQGGDYQPHLGSYEGVLPFQQLIRDIYVVTYTAWLIQETNPDSFEVLSP